MKKTLSHKKIEKFFYRVSKVIIFVPLAIMVLGLLFKLGKTADMLGKIKSASDEVALKITETPKKKLDFDLDGPYYCSYRDETITIEAYVKNRRVKATVTENSKSDRYLLDGDTVFINDTKIPYMGGYIALLENMIETDVDKLKEIWSSYFPKNPDIEEVIGSCRKMDFEDDIFVK